MATTLEARMRRMGASGDWFMGDDVEPSKKISKLKFQEVQQLANLPA
jgi:hypothetical protein